MHRSSKGSGMVSLAKWSALAVLLAAVLSACSTSSNAGKGDQVTYEDDIVPIFADHCLKCHGQGSSFSLTSYEEVLVFVNGEKAGALMRSLDNGENTQDGQPGNMYKYLGGTDAERKDNLQVIKEWVGHWTLKGPEELTDEDREKFVLTEK